MTIINGAYHPVSAANGCFPCPVTHSGATDNWSFQNVWKGYNGYPCSVRA